MEEINWRGGIGPALPGMHVQRLSLDDPTLDEHTRATLRRLSRFSSTGSHGLTVTPAEIERLHHSYVTAYSTPLGETILEEGTMEFVPPGPGDRSVSFDAVEAHDNMPLRQPSYVHPKTFRPRQLTDK